MVFRAAQVDFLRGNCVVGGFCSGCVCTSLDTVTPPRLVSHHVIISMYLEFRVCYYVRHSNKIKLHSTHTNSPKIYPPPQTQTQYVLNVNIILVYLAALQATRELLTATFMFVINKEINQSILVKHFIGYSLTDLKKLQQKIK
jgi:hypothetical protein